MTVEQKSIPLTFEYVGFTKSSHEVEIRARVSGYLEAINESEGKHVEKGMLLFQIDPRPFAAALEEAKGDLLKQQALLWAATRSVERLKVLYEQNAASRRDLDSAMAQQRTSEALVHSSEARIQKAELDLEYTQIRAPITGTIGASHFRVGALVNANETLLATMSAIDPIWINFSVPERAMLQAQAEKEHGRLEFPKDDNFDVEVTLIDGIIVPDKGKVDFLSPTYDSKTGTMLMRAVLPNGKGLLRPGQFVRVHISGASYPNAIVVPQRALIQSKDGMLLYIVNQENRVEVRHVEPGQWYGDQWIIRSGVQAADRVIVDGINKVGPGSLVQATALKGVIEP